MQLAPCRKEFAYPIYGFRLSMTLFVQSSCIKKTGQQEELQVNPLMTILCTVLHWRYQSILGTLGICQTNFHHAVLDQSALRDSPGVRESSGRTWQQYWCVFVLRRAQQPQMPSAQLLYKHSCWAQGESPAAKAFVHMMMEESIQVTLK